MADEDFLRTLPDTVTIMTPVHTIVPRGKASPLVNLQTVSIRLPQVYREAIDEATEVMGIPRSEFMRWCAYGVAVQILEAKRGYDKKRKR